jgi:hypothetical protein
MKIMAMLRGWLIKTNVRIHGAKKFIKFAPYFVNGSISPQQHSSAHKLVTVS